MSNKTWFEKRRWLTTGSVTLIALATGVVGCAGSPFDGSPLSAGDVELEEGAESVAEVADDEAGMANSSAGNDPAASDDADASADASVDGESATTVQTAETEEGSGGEAGEADSETVALASNLGVVSLASTDNLISTNPSNPLTGHGRFFIDQVVASDTYGEIAAEGDNTLLVVEYHLMGLSYGNFFDETFRVDVDGTKYSPITGINLLADVGKAVNNVLIFELPRSAIAGPLSIEGGVIDPTADGYASSYDVTFTGEPAPAPVEVAAENVEAVGVITQTSSGEPIFSTNLGSDQGRSSLIVRNATSTLKIGPDAAAPGFKFVQVDIEILGVEFGNLFDESFRVRTEDEWYSPLGNINELPGPGEAFNTTLVFQVPRTAEWLDFEAGVLEEAADGERVTYSIEFG